MSKKKIENKSDLNKANEVLKKINPIAAEAELCKRSFYYFYKKAFPILEPDVEFVDSWYIEFLCNRLQKEVTRIQNKERKEKDIIINVPPRCSKSLIISCVFPVWVWLNKPSTKFLTISFAMSLARDNSMNSQSLLNSDWFKSRFPELILTKDNEDEQHTEARGKRVALGVGGAITGKGADIIICDDLQDAESAESEAERKRTISYYTGTIYNRLNNPKLGVRIIIQQRLHANDLTGFLLETAEEKYEHICLPIEHIEGVVKPAELGKHYVDGLFDPVRFDYQELDNLKTNQKTSSRKYSAQYLQMPVSADGELFKVDWFKTITKEEFNTITSGKPATVNVTIDTAESEKKTGDATAVLAYTEIKNNFYILNVKQFRKSFTDLIKELKNYLSVIRVSSSSKVMIEGKSSGKSLISQLKQETAYNITELQPGKDSKFQRAESVTPICESGRVFFIQGDWNTEFETQLLSYPKGKNDDMVDAFVYALKQKLNRVLSIDFF